MLLLLLLMVVLVVALAVLVVLLLVAMVLRRLLLLLLMWTDHTGRRVGGAHAHRRLHRIRRASPHLISRSHAMLLLPVGDQTIISVYADASSS